MKKLIWVFLVLSACAAPTSRHLASTVDAPIELIGGGTDSFDPAPAPGPELKDTDRYDVVVIGGGLAGLSSAVYLTDHGLRVLLLEKEPQVGGLAAWGESKDHVRFDRGAAYWTNAYEEELAILKHIGLGDFEKKNPIPEPIDSYYVRGKFYPGIWEEKTLQELPASFALFKYELERANAEKKIPNQPIEDYVELEGGSLELDSMSARQWIESMPATMEKRRLDNPVWNRFARERGRLPGRTGMEDVIELMDLYCRSALGAPSDYVSAVAFANFYISEIETRFTTSQGTGAAADKMFQMLQKRKNFRALVSATVAKGGVVSLQNGMSVHFNYGGSVHRARAKYVVFAAQLKLAPELIAGFAHGAPEQAAIMKSLGYSNYSVHVVHVKGQPYRATYDTWTRAADYTGKDFTDVILGQWMDPRMRGYEGYRDFKKDPPVKDGILSIYHPVATSQGYSDDDARAMARRAVERMEDLYSELPSALWRGPLQVTKIQTNRWPLSVHIAEPGHYTKKARILRKPWGRVFFANNNLGTPAFEEALFRGHCAADNILARAVKGFRVEKWSRCPIER